jgi:hypothetical protein
MSGSASQITAGLVFAATVGLTGIQLSSSGAKIVPLIFYHLHSIALDIYELKKLKSQNY